MTKNIDFTNCVIDHSRNYGGANGNKIGVIYKDENYMLKFPPKANKNPMLSYSNSCYSEHIACSIANSIGLNAQDTILGNYNDKIVVACKDFEQGNLRFFDFASLKNTILDSETNGRDTSLSEILRTIENQYKIDSDKLKSFFWDTFVFDAYIANFDRHNGNWGFLVDRSTMEFQIAPIYDCGSCLFPQNTEKDFINIMSDEKEIDVRVYTYPKSAIRKDNNTGINYYEFLTTTDNRDCIESLKRVYFNIDTKKVNDIIDTTPYISENHKHFLKIILEERREKILHKALKINNNIYIKKAQHKGLDESPHLISDELISHNSQNEKIDAENLILTMLPTSQNILSERKSSYDTTLIDNIEDNMDDDFDDEISPNRLKL